MSRQALSGMDASHLGMDRYFSLIAMMMIISIVALPCSFVSATSLLKELQLLHKGVPKAVLAFSRYSRLWLDFLID
jgi:hypothetical protein